MFAHTLCTLFSSGTPFPGNDPHGRSIKRTTIFPSHHLPAPRFVVFLAFRYLFARVHPLTPSLSQYSKAVDLEQLERAGGKVVTCVFKDDGRVLSVFAKRARGLFARHVVVSRAGAVADLEAFSAEGYGLDRSQSGDGLLVFTRSKAQRAVAVPALPAVAKAKAKAKTKAKGKATPKGKATGDAKAEPKATATASSTASQGRKRAAPAGSAAAATKAGKKAAIGDGDAGAATARGKRAAPSTAAVGKKSASKARKKG